MASFSINFQANTNGDHYVGYRTYNDPVNTYTVETINVATPGPQTIEIDIPGNIYCGDIVYTGYVIAACQSQADTNGNGVPDAAITFTVTFNQETDPCVFTTITCDHSAIASLSINTPGTNYNIGDPIIFTESIVGSELFPATAEVSSVGGSGEITGIGILSSGSYQAPPTAVVNSGTGSSGTVSVTLANCPLLDIRDHQCAGDAGSPNNPTYDLPVGQKVSFCADVSTLGGLWSQFTSSTDTQCHCRECVKYSVKNNGASPLKATIQTCWDGSHPSSTAIVTTTYLIPPGGTYIDLGCAMEKSLILEKPSVMEAITEPC